MGKWSKILWRSPQRSQGFWLNAAHVAHLREPLVAKCKQRDELLKRRVIQHCLEKALQETDNSAYNPPLPSPPKQHHACATQKIRRRSPAPSKPFRMPTDRVNRTYQKYAGHTSSTRATATRQDKTLLYSEGSPAESPQLAANSLFPTSRTTVAVLPSLGNGTPSVCRPPAMAVTRAVFSAWVLRPSQFITEAARRVVLSEVDLRCTS